jgi:hypothetical protein
MLVLTCSTWNEVEFYLSNNSLLSLEVYKWYKDRNLKRRKQDK